MPTAIDIPLTNASSKLDRVRNDLLYIQATISTRPSAERDRAATLLASSYVWMAAVLETFVNSTIEGLIAEINNSGITHNQLIGSAFALVCSPEFQSLREIGGLKMWNKRASLFDTFQATTPVTLNSSVVPLDGRTIRPEHLETMWRVFNFAGTSVVSAKHNLALRDLAEGRNNVAHGHVDPISFGRSKVPTDVLNLLGYCEDIILHIYMTAETYVLNREFER